MSHEQVKPKGGAAERASKFFRNINLLGAAALTGAAIVLPELSAPLLAFAAVDIAQAAFFHGAAGFARSRNDRKAPKLAPAT